MSEPIKIVVTAETAAAAAALQQFVQNTGAGLKTIAAVGDEAGKHMGGVVYQFRAAIDAIRFAAMDGGPRAAFYAVDESIRALVASGQKMGTIVPVLGLVAEAAGLGYLMWKEYGGGVETAVEENEKLAESLKKIPELLKSISEAEAGGRVDSAQAQTWRDMLSGKIPLYRDTMAAYDPKNPNALSTSATGQPPGPPLMTEAQWRQKMVGVPEFESGTYDQYVTDETRSARIKADQQQNGAGAMVPATQDEITAQVNAQKEAAALDETRNAAAAELMRLHNEDAVEMLSGTQKLIAAENLRYENERKHILDQHTLAVAQGGTDPTAGLDDTALEHHNAALAKINDDAAKAEAEKSKEAARQRADAEKQIREQYAEQFKAANKAIEDQITADAAAAGQKREELYFRESVEKMAVATKFLIEGKITAAEYADAIAAAQNELTEGVEKQNAEYFRQLQLKRELARADAEVQLKRIQSNPFLTDTQKQQQAVPALQQEMAANDNSISDYQRMADTTKDDAARIAALTQIDDLKQRQVDIQNELNAAENANNFSYQLGEVMVRLQNIGTVQQQAAQVFSDVWTTATSSTTENFSQFIEKHQTWGETLRKIYKSVVDSFIQGMTKMAVEFVMNHGLMAEISAAWHAIETGQQAAATSTQVAIHASGETAKTGVTVAGATMRGAIGVAETVAHSIQVGIRTSVHAVGQLAMTAITFTETLIRKALAFLEAQPYIILAGIEAAAAVASIPYAGPILAPIAAATTIAALEGLAAFAEGGRPPVGVPSIIGEKGWELFVPDTAGTIVSHDKAVSMLNSSQREVNNAGSRGAAAAGKTEVHNFIYHDKAQLMEDLAKSAAFEKNVVDVMNRTIHKFR